MIKLTATALIHTISPVIEIPAKNGGAPFQKRELVLNDSWERDGETHPNFVVIEITGDAMMQLDNFIPGQRVTVDAMVNGREYNGRIFNTIKGRTVTLYQPRQTAAVSQQQPYQPQPTYAQQPYQQVQRVQPTPSAPGYNGQYPQAPQQYQQPAPQYQQPVNPQYGGLGPADLPFPT